MTCVAQRQGWSSAPFLVSYLEDVLRRLIVKFSILLVVLAGALTVHVPASPLGVRNVSPVVQLYGIPRMTGARVAKADWDVSFNVEIGNNFQSERGDTAIAFFDGETYVNSFRARRGFANHWEWGVEIPWVVHAPGSLDGLIDEFHELFGLPDAGRSSAPRGRLDYFVADNEMIYADFDNSRRGLGDARAYVGWSLIDQPGTAFVVRSMIKLPTGKVDKLTGSEAMDIALWGEYERHFRVAGKRLRLSLGGGVARLGEGNMMPEQQEDWVHFGHLGVQIPIHPRVELHAQLDAHSRVLDTGNPVLADGGLLGTLGGRVGVTQRLWLDLAVIEDLAAESASDVVFQILLGMHL